MRAIVTRTIAVKPVVGDGMAASRYFFCCLQPGDHGAELLVRAGELLAVLLAVDLLLLA